MVDEGKFRLMPRVDAPFVRVCVLSMVGGTGVGKFRMFSLFSHFTMLFLLEYCTVRCGAPTQVYRYDTCLPSIVVSGASPPAFQKRQNMV